MKETELEVIQNLSSFLPQSAVQRILSHDFSKPVTSSATHFEAALLFADISGFSKIAEELAKKGTAGVEELTHVINSYFDEIISIILRYGGDIIQFAGDAVIAAWDTSIIDETPQSPSPMSLVNSDEAKQFSKAQTTRKVQVCEKAANCALEIQSQLLSTELDGNAATHSLSMHFAVTIGKLVEAQIGGFNNKWQVLIGGEAIEHLRSFQKLQSQSGIVLSPFVWKLLKDRCNGDTLDQDGHTRLLGFKIAKTDSALQYVGHHTEENTQEAPKSQITEYKDAQKIIETLQSFLPDNILRTLVSSGQKLGELRTVSLFFMCVLGLDVLQTSTRALLQDGFAKMQEIVKRYDGNICNVLHDEKGLQFIVCFGLPGFSHEDDATRAVKTALKCKHTFQELGLRVSVGISTGKLYCGTMGNAQRKTYTILGNVVNRAARLAHHHHSNLDIWCDQETQSAASTLEFEKLPDVFIKGRSAALTVYRAMGAKKLNVQNVSIATAAMVGRAKELNTLVDCAKKSVNGEGKIIVIEGKSTLIGEFYKIVLNLFGNKVQILRGASNESETFSSFYTFRTVLLALLEIEEEFLSPEESKAKVLSKIQSAELQLVSPVLNEVLPELSLSGNRFTEKQTHEAKRNSILNLIVYLLTSSATPQCPLILLLEDAHWFDPSTWSVVLAIAGYLQHIVIIVTTRPNNNPSYKALLQKSTCQKIRLGVLGPKDIENLICGVLEISATSSSVPGRIVQAVISASQGNPFFAEAMIQSWKESGILEVANGKCTLKQGMTMNMFESAIPETVQTAIISRIDRLSAKQQLLLKVASVIGREFNAEILKNAIPTTEGIVLENVLLTFDADLKELLNGGLIMRKDKIPKTPDPKNGLTPLQFKHALIRDVAYSTQLQSQRKVIHLLIAQYYESKIATTHENVAQQLYPKLALHFHQAQEYKKAVQYYEKAGNFAVKAYANYEVIEFFTSILNILDDVKHSSIEPLFSAEEERAKRAYLEREIGTAYVNIGEIAKSFTHLSNALKYSGSPLPSPGSKIFKIIGLFLKHQRNRMFPQKFIGKAKDPEKRRVKEDLASVYTSLTRFYYFRMDIPSAFYAAFKSMTIAESLGPSAQLATDYAHMAIGWMVMKQPAKSEEYLSSALAIAKQAKDPQATLYVHSMYAQCHIAFCRWDLALKHCGKMFKKSARYQFERPLNEARTWFGMVHMPNGDFPKAVKHLTDSLEAGRKFGDVQLIGVNCPLAAHCFLMYNDLHTAYQLVKEGKATALASPVLDLAFYLPSLAYLAYIELQWNKMDEFHQTMEELLKWAKTIKNPGNMPSMSAYHVAAQCCLEVLEKNIHTYSAYLKQAQFWLSHMKKLASKFPIGDPIYCYLQGYMMVVTNRSLVNKAIEHWKRGVQSARQKDMKIEEGICLTQLAKYSSDGVDYKSQAVELFQRCGCVFWLNRARQLNL